MQIAPSEFWEMSVREFYAALYIAFPPDPTGSKSKNFVVTDDPFFTNEELIIFKELKGK